MISPSIASLLVPRVDSLRMALRLAISRQDRCTGVTVMAQNGKTRVDVTPHPVPTFVGRAGGEMPSIHDEARADRGTAVELVLTGRRLPRFALLLTAMLAELTLAPFINMLPGGLVLVQMITDRKSTRLNSSHTVISY